MLGTKERKTRALIVDDSAAVRQTLKAVLESDAAIEVVGVAPRSYAAVERLMFSSDRRRVTAAGMSWA